MRIIKSTLFYVIGGTAYLLLRNKHQHARFHRSVVTYAAERFGGLGLGLEPEK